MSESEEQLQRSPAKMDDPVVDSITESLSSTVLCEDAVPDFQQELLEGFECPFNWKLDDITIPKDIIRDVRNKILELTEESVDFDHFQWNRFNLKLLLSYLLTNSHEYTEAIEMLDECSQILQELENDNCKEPLFSKIKNALWHVTLVSRVYTLLKSGSESKAVVKELLGQIPSAANMTDVEKAGIYGIKTQMLFQYGHDGNVLALESAKMARDLDPEMAEWWFIVGKTMGRIRRIVERMECVEKEEIKTLEKAVELQDSTSYIVFLAQTYRECSLRAFKKFQSQVDLRTHDLGKYIDTLNEKALNLYMQAVDKRKNCPRTMSRCAAGLMRLPGRFKRTQLAEKILLEALELAPDNAFAHHAAGLLYYNYPYKNLQKALVHYEKASELGNYGASMDLLRLRSEMNSEYDPYEDILKYVDKYKPEVHQVSLSCELGSYFLFKKRDIIKAIEYYTEVIKKDKVSLLKSNFVAFLSLEGPVNLLKITIDEARLALQSSDSLSKEDKLTIRKFLVLTSTTASELLDVEPELNQIEKILEKSKMRMTKGKQNTSYDHRTKTRAAKNENEQREWFQNPRGRRGMKNQFGSRSENSGSGDDKGHFKMRSNVDSRERNEKEYPGRNESGSKRGNFRPRGNSNTAERNWRTRSDDDSENNQTQQNRTHNDRERLKNRCWRTEGRAAKTNDTSDETYRFPVNVPKKS